MKNKKLTLLRQRAERILNASKKKLSPRHSEVLQHLFDELSVHQIELEIQNEDLIKTQLELEAVCNQYTELYESAPIGYFTLDKHALIVNVNEAGAKLLALPKKNLINCCFSRYVSLESQAIFSSYHRQLFNAKGTHAFQLKLLRWHGPVLYATLNCKYVMDSISKMSYLLVAITDITETKQQEELIHHERLKISFLDRLTALNELVSNISQEQNHSLTMLDNYLHGCIRRLENKNLNAEELLNGLKKAAEHSRCLFGVTYRIKKLIANNFFHFDRWSINTVIAEVVDLLHFEMIGFPVNLYFDPRPNLPSIRIDKTHIQQVILTLARNAIEAMREAKTLEPKIIIDSYLINKNTMEIAVIDNGPGFNPVLADKLFEPHFTTKPNGMGLGLTQSLTIVKKHSGSLSLRLNPTVGVCAKVVLPCVTYN